MYVQHYLRHYRLLTPPFDQGKYLEIMFNTRGEPVGAQITNYLLEKGRVVGQIENERDFHIFYQFTKGATDEQRGTSDTNEKPYFIIKRVLQRCLVFKVLRLMRTQV